jgi:ABC-type amino acid transport substrate-binding protein
VKSKTWLALGAAWALACSAHAASLDEIKARGRISVAVYNDFPPFHAAGKGFDVDLAHALAETLGVKATLLPFDASDESMADDLRNMVWKGHYLGYGPADVMMHVPVTSELMRENPQVSVFSPYYGERIGIAWDRRKLTTVNTTEALTGHKIGAEMASVSSYLIVTADGGKHKGQVKHFRFPTLAVAALKAGELSAVIAQRSELEGLLASEPHFIIADAPFPASPRTQWPIGLAVSKANVELGAALAEAMAALKSSGELGRLLAKYKLSTQ